MGDARARGAGRGTDPGVAPQGQGRVRPPRRCGRPDPGLPARRRPRPRRLGRWSSCSTSTTTSACAAGLMRTRAGEVTVKASGGGAARQVAPPAAAAQGARCWRTATARTHGGVADPEVRYRQRYADLAVHPEVREVFRLRSRIDHADPGFLDGRGFLEVETPILQPLYGGAAARPFVTHHNALDMQLYPAHRRRAVSQAADRRRPGAGVRDRPRLPERGHGPDRTIPSSPCWSCTRPTPTTGT